MTKTRIAIIMGGTNTEHEVSLVSARAVLKNLDQTKYQLIPITITKDNQWQDEKGQGVKPSDLPDLYDLVFPVLHGPYGEDGTLQGMLEILRIPYVGCGVAGSAVCMDKVMQKDLCQAYDIPQVPYFWLTLGRWQDQKEKILTNIQNKFANDYPLFIKPANSGSSVGVTKVKSTQELETAIGQALTRDTKVIIEQGINHAREIECSVLGPNHTPETSVLGEIIPHADFYDYDTKYLSDTSEAVIPAKLSPQLIKKIQSTARLAYEVLGCDGLARVDFLLDPETNDYYLNELNTMPGFTPISMYPKLWEASGLSFSDLLDRLIDLALYRHQARSSLNLSH